MNRSQVETIFGAAFGFAFALIMGLSAASSFYMDVPRGKAVVMGVAWLGASGILWCLPFILQKIRRRKEVYVDERELMIYKNAALAAYTVSGLYLLCACSVAWWIVGPGGSVPVNVIPLIFVGWVVVFQIVHIISSLIQ